MSAQLIDGKALAAQTNARSRERAEALLRRGVQPAFAVVLVGDDPASVIYVRRKNKASTEAGIRFVEVLLPADTTQERLEAELARLNADPAVHGVLLQLPLPAGLDTRRALDLIDPEKDVDGFHPVNGGRLLSGHRAVVPCTAAGILALIHTTGVPVEGKHAVVVGRSDIVGKPTALLLLRENATVTVCHSRTRDLAAMTRQADILVVAAGKAGLITAGMVKPGAVVVDAGISRVDGKVKGDVDFDAVREVAGWITPVPGGCGPMTVAMLLSNTLDAAERQTDA